MLPSDQSRTIKKANSTCSPSGKSFEKQIKTVEYTIREQVEVLKVLKPAEYWQKTKSIEAIFPNDLENNEINN